MRDIIMYGFYKTYMNMFNKSIISQADQDDDLNNLEDDSTEEPEEDIQQEKDEKSQQSNNQQQDETKLTDQKDNDIDMKFSADLASEFGNTVNEFTHIAATVIKQRSINKSDTDKIYNLMSKIKNLLDAAGKSI